MSGLGGSGARLGCGERARVARGAQGGGEGDGRVDGGRSRQPFVAFFMSGLPILNEGFEKPEASQIGGRQSPDTFPACPCFLAPAAVLVALFQRAVAAGRQTAWCGLVSAKSDATTHGPSARAERAGPTILPRLLTGGNVGRVLWWAAAR